MCRIFIKHLWKSCLGVVEVGVASHMICSEPDTNLPTYNYRTQYSPSPRARSYAASSAGGREGIVFSNTSVKPIRNIWVVVTSGFQW